MKHLRRLVRAPLARDLALAVFAVASVAFVSGQIEPSGDDRSLDALAYASIAAAGGALAARRSSPIPVIGVVTAALSVYLARGYAGGPVFVTLLVALYSLAVTGERRRAFAAAALTTGWLIGVGTIAGTGSGLIHLVFGGWAAAAVFLGDAVRSRREHLAGLEERARHLEQSREEEARRRVMEERLRIARDLHDSVAHSMATINVQAGTAAHVIDRHPERGREALAVIQQASREVLDELGALLGLLRLDADERPSRVPTPDLGHLDDLVASTRRAGLEVRLEVDGGLGPVTQPVGVAAFRIVQESLTNVVRHAGPGAAATVRVVGDGHGGLTVEVVDDGAGSAAASVGAGVGITGMRERAATTGDASKPVPAREVASQCGPRGPAANDPRRPR